MHTAYEYIARSRGKPTSEIQWIDPSQNIVPSPPPKQMGFQVDCVDNATSGDAKDTSTSARTDINKEIDPMILRLPIYPVSAVHIPSSAYHTLHNTQFKNIKMARDLEANKWTITLKDQTTEGLDLQCDNRDEEKNEIAKDGGS